MANSSSPDSDTISTSHRQQEIQSKSDHPIWSRIWSHFQSHPSHVLALLFSSALLLRLFIIFITSWYDTNAIVKYTDVDYFVFDDASRFVYRDLKRRCSWIWNRDFTETATMSTSAASGVMDSPLDGGALAYKGIWASGSPYLRKTYRYTPLLAYILLPNHFLHPIFGKVLFSFIDLLIAWLILRIGAMHEKERNLERRKKSDSDHEAGNSNRLKRKFSWILVVALTVLFNPIVFNISTRGNADQLVLGLVLLAVYFFYRRRYNACAIFYGLSVHFKIYPIIYAPVFYLAIADRKFNVAGRVYPVKNLADKFLRSLKLIGRGLLNVQLWIFTLMSAGVVLLLGALFYHLYGYECIYETYLYHLIRSDNRHNFSVYFYHIYLSVMAPKSATALLMFVPQMVLLLLMALLMYRSLLECILVQTLAFVAFNKVCTVQYFVWYIPIFSFLLLRWRDSAQTNDRSSVSEDANKDSPIVGWRATVLHIGTCIVVWFITQALWLQSAYELEFLGNNTFLRVWICGLLFFSANVGVIAYVLLTRHRSEPTTQQQTKHS